MIDGAAPGGPPPLQANLLLCMTDNDTVTRVGDPFLEFLEKRYVSYSVVSHHPIALLGRWGDPGTVYLVWMCMVTRPLRVTGAKPLAMCGFDFGTIRGLPRHVDPFANGLRVTVTASCEEVFLNANFPPRVEALVLDGVAQGDLEPLLEIWREVDHTINHMRIMHAYCGDAHVSRETGKWLGTAQPLWRALLRQIRVNPRRNVRAVEEDT